jgi:hypothetical protein
MVSETPSSIFFFQNFIGKILYFSVKKGIIHSHRDLNSVSSSTDKTNLLVPIPSRLRSPVPRVHHPVPRVRKTPRGVVSSVGGADTDYRPRVPSHRLSVATSTTQQFFQIDHDDSQPDWSRVCDHPSGFLI